MNSTNSTLNYNNMNQTETVAQVSYFQWTRGENLGNIEEWDGSTDIIDGSVFYIFRSGKMGNTELEGEFFMKITSPNEPLIDPDGMEGTLTQKQPPRPIVKQIRDNAVVPKQAKVDANPVASLLDKSIKTDTNQNLRLSIPLPPKDLIKVVANSFDDGEDNVLNYLIDQISIEDIKKQIKEQLRLTLFVKKSK